MASKLPSTLIKDFSKLINERQTNPTPQYLKGTTKISGDKKYVQIDGSSSLTPIAETVDIQEGDRVLVSIENHKATVLGNFTFPPNARKEQEAVDKADEAITDSNVALENATEAKQNAATAMENASAAQSSATEAIGKAEDAMENVQTAITKAETALSDASDAKELANQAADKATESLESVSAAQNEIDQIQNEVGTVQDDISQALTDLAEQAGEIETIQTNLSTNYATKTELGTVEAELNQTITSSISELSTSISQTYAAKTDVVEMTGELQTQITQNTESISSQATKIETIEADTAAAQAAVEEAKSAANQAQTIANEAKTNANTAIANAATAQSAANQAQEDADAAAQAASTAQQKADAADEAVQQAQNDLAEAEANLASVTTRVDATEEEIAEAQQAVEQAQQEVDQALADAATANYAAQQAAQAAQTAQDTADTAKTNAEYAQTAADNAQAAADNAQEAADQAQADVAALTQRVTTAETNIEQNAEQISLNASKTEEIGNLLENNYYSKEETDAAIDVAADQITSEVTTTVETTVKEEIEKIEVGARNLFLNSSFKMNLDEWKTDYVGKPDEPEGPETPTEKPKIYVDSTLVEDGGTYQAGNAEGVSVRCECEYEYTWTYRGGEQPGWGDSQWLVKNTDPNGNTLSVKDIYNNQTTVTIFFTDTIPETLSETDPLEDTDPPEDVDIYTDPLTNITSCRITSNDDASVCQDVSPRLSVEDAAKIYTISGDFKLDNYVASETSKAELFFKGNRSVSEIPNLLDHPLFDGSDPEIPETIVSASYPMDNGWLFSGSDHTIVYDNNEKAYHANIDIVLDWYFQQEITSKVQDATVDDVYIFEIVAKVSGTNPTNSYFRLLVLDRDNGTSNINKLTPGDEEFFANSDEYITYQYKFKFNDVSNLTDIQACLNARCTSNGGVPIDIYFKKFALYKQSTTPVSELIPITATTQSGLADLTQYFGKGWVESKWTVELSGIPNYLATNEYLDVGVRVFDFVGDLYFKNLKLEKGNKMTDWTPAPEDQEDQWEDAILENNETVRQNYTSLINQQADRISALISRVESTEDSLNSVETSISNKIEITEDDISLIKETVTKLEDAVNGQMSVQELIEWIRIEGASMTLGKSDSKIVGKLTNDRLVFMNGDKEVAYFSADGMYVFQAIIAKQLTCGAYSWVDEEELGFSLV